ncbi:MAG: DUF1868 domain-containing protein [Deinococcota bacterium]
MTTSATPSALTSLTGDGQHTLTPTVGTKFYKDGCAKTFPGNTIICHVPRPSMTFDALVQLQEALKTSPHVDHFSYLPASSFHMTVSEGVTNGNRACTHWPQDMPLDASVEDVTAHMVDKLRGLTLPTSFKVRPTSLGGARTIGLEPANASEEKKLRDTRNKLADVLNLRTPHHDAYGFHITLAYLIRYLSPEDAQTVLDKAELAYEEFVKCVPEIELEALEFCTFNDMTAFEPQLILGQTS